MASPFGPPFRLLLATAQTLGICHVTSTYFMSGGHGTGPSMLPTFATSGEYFVTDKSCRRGRGVRVGDCVTFTIPVAPNKDEGLKRVVGMPGDYVLMNSPPSPVRVGGGAAEGADGEKLVNEGAGNMDRAGRGGSGFDNMIQVPKGHCFVAGDNLPWSRDSRDYGPIPLALIKGKVIGTLSFDSWNPMTWFNKLENGLQRPVPASYPSEHLPGNA